MKVQPKKNPKKNISWKALTYLLFMPTAHRLSVWKGVSLMIKDNPAAGTGPGTFEVAYPLYQQPGYPIPVIYAHNDYLQFAAEAGILFVPLMLWLLFLFFRAGFAKFKNLRRQTAGIVVGCMAAVIAILIRSYSDGNVHIPANALFFTALSALFLKSRTLYAIIRLKNTVLIP